MKVFLFHSGSLVWGPCHTSWYQNRCPVLNCSIYDCISHTCHAEMAFKKLCVHATKSLKWQVTFLQGHIVQKHWLLWSCIACFLNGSLYASCSWPWYPGGTARKAALPAAWVHIFESVYCSSNNQQAMPGEKKNPLLKLSCGSATFKAILLAHHEIWARIHQTYRIKAKYSYSTHKKYYISYSLHSFTSTFLLQYWLFQFITDNLNIVCKELLNDINLCSIWLKLCPTNYLYLFKELLLIPPQQKINVKQIKYLKTEQKRLIWEKELLSLLSR